MISFFVNFSNVCSSILNDNLPHAVRFHCDTWNYFRFHPGEEISEGYWENGKTKIIKVDFANWIYKMSLISFSMWTLRDGVEEKDGEIFPQASTRHLMALPWNSEKLFCFFPKAFCLSLTKKTHRKMKIKSRIINFVSRNMNCKAAKLCSKFIEKSRHISVNKKKLLKWIEGATALIVSSLLTQRKEKIGAACMEIYWFSGEQHT